MEHLIKRWEVADRVGLSPEAAEEQEYLCKLPDRIRKLSERAAGGFAILLQTDWAACNLLLSPPRACLQLAGQGRRSQRMSNSAGFTIALCETQTMIDMHVAHYVLSLFGVAMSGEAMV